MNPYYILICGPAVLLMLAVACLLAWVVVAPYKAWQNVQDRR